MPAFTIIACIHEKNTPVLQAYEAALRVAGIASAMWQVKNLVLHDSFQNGEK
jgi:hypothetical protein